MSSITESGHAGGFLLSEAAGQRSREKVTIASGQNLGAGTVLGKISGDGTYAIYDNDASDGTQTAVAILFADCDASDGEQEATVIARDAEVNGEELIFASGVDEDGAVTDMASAGIIVRS